MAFDDGNGNGWIFRDGKVVAFSRGNELTPEGREHLYEQKEAITRCLLEDARCLVAGGEYSKFLRQLFELYDSVPQASEQGDQKRLYSILHETDGLAQKLQRGFVQEKDREVFLEYTVEKRTSIVSKL